MLFGNWKLLIWLIFVVLWEFKFGGMVLVVLLLMGWKNFIVLIFLLFLIVLRLLCFFVLGLLFILKLVFFLWC